MADETQQPREDDSDREEEDRPQEPQREGGEPWAKTSSGDADRVTQDQ